MHSTTAPMRVVGVRRGWNGGIDARMVSNHPSGSFGSQWLGSLHGSECVGTTTVPARPTASSSASTTA